MKNYFKLSLSVCVMTVLVSCGNKKATSPIEGTWEITHVAGIQVAGVDPNFKKGNGNVLKFSGDHFEKFTDGTKVESGVFSLQPESELINNSKSNYALSLNDAEKVSVLLSDNKLVLFNGIIAADGTEVTYEKQ